jgi:hypothetical protein
VLPFRSESHRAKLDRVVSLAPRCIKLILVAAVTFGCKSRPVTERRWVSCTCEYVTDFDQPGHIVVEVCAEGQAEDPATSCARGSGVGAVTACTCSQASQTACDGREPCRLPGR